MQHNESALTAQYGFTLIEILVALFVFTILSMIMVSGLHSITTTQAATEQRAERLGELQIALTILSRDFEQVVNRPTMNVTGLENAFVGSAKMVSFTHGGLTNPLGKLRRSTLQRTQYYLMNGNLIRNSSPVLDHAMKVKSDERILLTDLSDLRFEYFDNKNNVLERWPSANQPQEIMPKAVRIFITLRHSGKISQLYVIPAQNPEPLPINKTGKPNNALTT